MKSFDDRVEELISVKDMTFDEAVLQTHHEQMNLWIARCLFDEPKQIIQEIRPNNTKVD